MLPQKKTDRLHAKKTPKKSPNRTKKTAAPLR
jgi:hypothetical protein